MLALPLPCLALVTQRQLCTQVPLEQQAEQALDGGVDLVQLREKDLPAGELLKLAERLRQITRGRALLVVNDRADVALACGADGVQLGEESMPVGAVRKVAGRGLLVGRSVHSVAGAVQAEREGADFLVVGTIFPTSTHPDAAASGPGLLEEVGRQVRVPYLAIGGVTADNAASCIAAGASGVAVITAILGMPDPAASARALSESLQQAWARRSAARAGAG
ncbi:MAG: thiamine phosphate synthase [Chloroflexi bacterium]|nr:thiamine phosphate synthase [Chloroflexota bacterium]